MLFLVPGKVQSSSWQNKKLPALPGPPNRIDYEALDTVDRDRKFDSNFLLSSRSFFGLFNAFLAIGHF